MRTKQPKLTNDRAIALWIARRAIDMVTAGANHLDAITTQVQAAGIGPEDPGYMEIGREALRLLLEEKPLWRHKSMLRGEHKTGWLEFVSKGTPDRLPPPASGGSEDNDDDTKEGESSAEEN